MTTETHRLVSLLLNIFLYNSLLSSSQANAETFSPQIIRPNHYDLRVDIFLNGNEKFTFGGLVNINLTTLEITDNITLHSKDLSIQSVDLLENDETIETITKVNQGPNNDLLVIVPKYSLRANTDYSLSIAYKGQITKVETSEDKLEGIYSGFYFDEGYSENYFVMTNTKSGNARKVFPCFDETFLKSTFNISISREEEYTTLSNMEALERNITIPGAPGRKLDVFQTTTNISTSSISFMVSDFKSRNTGKVTIYGKPRFVRENYFDSALVVANETLKELQKFLEIDYPFSKLDVVAIPDLVRFLAEDSAGYPGIIYFREETVVGNTNVSSAEVIQKMFASISGMVAKQWFEDEPRFEDEWWLKAIYRHLGYYVSSLIEPMWKITDLSVLSMQDALVYDSLEGTLSLENKDLEDGNDLEDDKYLEDDEYLKDDKDLEDDEYLEDDKDLEDNKDLRGDKDLKDSKGVAILRMVHNMLGEEAFRKGLQNYLLYTDRSSGILYQFWQQEFDPTGRKLNLTEFMESWTKQPGHPLVYISRDHEGHSLSIRQEIDYLRTNFSSKQLAWTIPVNYVKFSNADFEDTSSEMFLNQTHWIDTETQAEEWLVLNPQEVSFYRTIYNERNWNLLIDFLTKENFTKMHPINRANLIDDAFNLARAGKLNYSIAFDLAKYLKDENEYAPVRAFSKAMNFLHTMFSENEETLQSLNQYTLDILEPIYQRIGFEVQWNDSPNTMLLRSTILPILCKFGHADCRGRSSEFLVHWLSDKTYQESVVPDLQSTVYCYGRSAENLEVALDAFRASYVRYMIVDKPDVELTKIVEGLGCTDFKEISFEYLKLLTTDDDQMTNLGHRIAAFKSVYSHNGAFGVTMALGEIVRNFTGMKDLYGEENTSNILRDIGFRITTEEQQQLLAQFISDNQISFDGLIEQAVYEMDFSAKFNQEWIEEIGVDIKLYFS